MLPFYDHLHYLLPFRLGGAVKIREGGQTQTQTQMSIAIQTNLFERDWFVKSRIYCRYPAQLLTRKLLFTDFLRFGNGYR